MESENLLKREKYDSKALPSLPRAPTISVTEVGDDGGGGFRRSGTPSTMGAAQFGIYWRSPVTVLSTLVFGLAAALSLHGYHASLDGKQVGDSAQQQKALRYVVC